MKKLDELEAARDMEADCTIGAGAGFGKYTSEVAEQRRNRDKPGSSAGIHCHGDGCVETLTLTRTTTAPPSHEDDYQNLMPARDEAAVFLGWRVYRSVWWCPTHVVANKLTCARCLTPCPGCSCVGGPRVDAVDGDHGDNLP